MLIGYNLAFWIIKQSFYLNISPASLNTTELSLISSSWKNVAELFLIGIQFAAFAYALTFPLPFPIYKVYLVLASLNFGSLFINVYGICKSAKVPLRPYISSYFRLISTTSLLILLFAVYEIQIAAGDTPENSFDFEDYKDRIVAINGGHK